jgi:hypothetical protein
LASPFHTAQFRYKKENKMFTLFNSIVLIAFVGALLAACSSQPTATPVPVTPQGNNPYVPQPGDEIMMRGNADIVSGSILMVESFPPQISVSLAYRLTNPCYQLCVSISQPDSLNRIQLEIYGVAHKDMPCNQIALLTPQEANISRGSFPAGHYTVWVNGVQVCEFNSWPPKLPEIAGF